MKDFELTLKLRNNRLKRRRRELGLSPREMAAEIGISYTIYLQYEGLKRSPLSKLAKTQWNPSALKIAEFYCCSPQELWPDVVLAVSKPEVVVEVEGAKMLAAAASAPAALPAPDEIFDTNELAVNVAQVLGTLTSREADIVSRRFGLGPHTESTLQEVADHYGLSADRIRQIEVKALRKLRHPSRAKNLRAFVSPDVLPEEERTPRVDAVSNGVVHRCWASDGPMLTTCGRTIAEFTVLNRKYCWWGRKQQRFYERPCHRCFPLYAKWWEEWFASIPEAVEGAEASA